VREATEAVSEEVAVRRCDELVVRRWSNAGLDRASEISSDGACEELGFCCWWWGLSLVVGRAALLLEEALTELLPLFVRVAVGSGLAAESGVIEPLVPDRNIRLLPPRSEPSPAAAAGLFSSSGELSGEQAVTFCNGAVGLDIDGRLYDPDETSGSAIRGALVVGGERRTS